MEHSTERLINIAVLLFSINKSAYREDLTGLECLSGWGKVRLDQLVSLPRYIVYMRLQILHLTNPPYYCIEPRRESWHRRMLFYLLTQVSISTEYEVNYCPGAMVREVFNELKDVPALPGAPTGWTQVRVDGQIRSGDVHALGSDEA